MSAQNPIASIAAPDAVGSWREAGLAAALLAGAVALFALSALRAGAAPLEVAGASLCFAWLFMGCVAPGTRLGRSALGAWLSPAPGRRGALVVILMLAGFAAYALAARLLGPRAVAALPLQSASVLLVFQVALLLVTVVTALPGIGYSLALGRRDLASAGAAFAAFAAIAIPIGVATGFLHFGYRPIGALEWSLAAFRIAFLIALPEELVFRGLLQNALERRVFASRRGWLALAIAALVFGASHMGHPPAPNWRYGLLATLAGLAYGWAWRRTGKITVSALVHAAVDLVWVVAFGGP